MTPQSDSGTSLDTARSILHEVRRPEGVFLESVDFEPESLRTVGVFRCPRSRQFPNPVLEEVTGGQLMDVIAQSAYVTAGLLLQHGVDIFDADYETFLHMIHQHRVNYVKSEMRFQRPCLVAAPFEVTATLIPYPDGSTTVVKRDGNGERTLGLVKMAFEGRQRPSASAPIETLFTAEIVACCRWQ